MAESSTHGSRVSHRTDRRAIRQQTDGVPRAKPRYTGRVSACLEDRGAGATEVGAPEGGGARGAVRETGGSF